MALPSRTYAITGNRIVGMIDGADAVRQAIYKLLQTDRFRYWIYSANYGHECAKLQGRDPSIAVPEASRYIREALLQDDRITAVDPIHIEVNGDSLTASFTVATTFGRISIEQEV